MSERLLVQWKAMPLMKQLGWTVVALAVLANAPRWIEASLVAGGVSVHWTVHTALEVVTALGLVAAFTMGAIVIVHSVASYRERGWLVTGLLLAFLVLAWLAIPAILAPYTVSLLVDAPMASIITGAVAVPWTAWAWAAAGILVAELMIAGATVALAGPSGRVDAPSTGQSAEYPAPSTGPSADLRIVHWTGPEWLTRVDDAEFTRVDVEAAADVGKSRAAALLKEACDAGLVERVASGRYRKLA